MPVVVDADPASAWRSASVALVELFVDALSLELLEVPVLEVLELELLAPPGPPGGGPMPPGPADFMSDNSVLTSVASVLDDVLLLSVEPVVELDVVPDVLLELLDDCKSLRSLSISLWTLAPGSVVDEWDDDVSPLEVLDESLPPFLNCDSKAASPDDTGVELVVLSVEPVVDVVPELVLDDEDAAWLPSVEFAFCNCCRSILCGLTFDDAETLMLKTSIGHIFSPPRRLIEG